MDSAFIMLQRAPQNAQNIKVWNTLIHQCMEAKKYNLAYSVFTDVRSLTHAFPPTSPFLFFFFWFYDTWLTTEHVAQMKRRGFMPNVRTYATMMSGYANVEDWERFSKQLMFVHSLYAQLKQHLKKPRNEIDDFAGESGFSFILFPISLYIAILGKAGEYQKAFDVFHELDTEGPLAPHAKIYSTLLCLLADRVDSADAEPEDIAQSVSDAKYVWKRQMRSLDRTPRHHIEPRAVDAIIKVLSRGEPSDLELTFDILHDICGLPRLLVGAEDRPPSSPSPSPPSPPKVAPTIFILSEALDSCIAAGHPDKAVHYAESVMSAPELRSILRPWHLHKLLRAHILLAEEGSTSPARAESAAAWVEWMLVQARDEKLAPDKHVLALALELCYRCEDIDSALRIARTMLGGPMHGFMPVKAWAHLLRLALVAPPGGKRQCLELLDTYPSVLDVWESTSAVQRLAPLEKKAHVSLALCVVQVLRTVSPSPDHDSASRPDDTELGQNKVWSDLRGRAESFLEKNHR